MKNKAAFISFAILLTGAAISYMSGRTGSTEAADVSTAIVGPKFSRAGAFSRSARLDGEAPAAGSASGPISSPTLAGFDIPTGSSRTSDTSDPPVEILPFGTKPMPEPSLSIDGLTNLDNAAIYNLLFLPADMTGDVGPNHYVQAVNSLIRVYDKLGNPITPPRRLSSIFERLGTPCSTRNDGLANVLYDALADRWLVSQTCTNFPPFRQMIAVSTSPDPAGEYFAYEFTMPNMRIHDFPKFGVWHDGYYMSTDEFLGSDYYGSGMFAFDREKMINGDPAAAYIYFNLHDPVPVRRRGMIPADLDGLRPPPEGSPNIFASYTANEYGDAADAIRLFDLHADFTSPERSTFRERAESPLAAAAFDPTSPEGRADISQPPPGEKLDSQSDRINHRLAYRNHGTHESLVTNQTVRMTPQGDIYRAGVRIYELRRVSAEFAVHDTATLGDTGSSRWIASAAQDHRSNTAVQYNYVTDEKEPSILYSGRSANDPAGAYRAERYLVEGTGVQKAFGWRWGEYSGMAVDPTDDCTFWITNGYYTQESEEISDFTWLTRIGRFKFEECEAAPRAVLAGTVRNALTGAGIEGVRVSVGSGERRTGPGGGYGPVLLLPGTYDVEASAPGYRPATAVIIVADGDERIVDLVLEPVPLPAIVGSDLTSESCAVNNAAEPGERVTLNVSVRNTGLRDAADLNAQALAGNGILDPGPRRSFGPVPAGGEPIDRAFSFTVSPAAECGSPLSLRLLFRDGEQELGVLEIPLRTGVERVAFSEDFDGTATGLPKGWSTSAEGNQPWRLSTARPASGANSIYSPSPIQKGVNQLVSPPIAITSDEGELLFSNWYELETTFLRNRLYDGSVLEISIGSSRWEDIVAAGGEFRGGGYDGLIDACCSNPLAGRPGWSGRSGTNNVSEFIVSSVALPQAAKGRSIRLRWRVGTDIGGFREGQYLDDIRITDGFVCSCTATGIRPAPFDLDGDGRTDAGVYDLNDDAGRDDGRVLRSSDQMVDPFSFGSTGDAGAFADYDGDGRSDIAVFRPATGVWYVLRSSDGAIDHHFFGAGGDMPLPFDYDGDRKDDIAVFRPSEGTWYIKLAGGEVRIHRFGLIGDVPVPADYDGDGEVDLAVYRPSNGVWYQYLSEDGSVAIRSFGLGGDVAVPGDFDGDRKADLALFRPSDGTWYILRSEGDMRAVRFGSAGDQPIQTDMDGDGIREIAVFRPSTQAWYYLRSSDGEFRSFSFGAPGERPIPGMYIP